MLKGVLFDMDGVLLDSELLTSEAAIRFFGKKGARIKYEDFYPFYGTGEQGYFGGVAEKYGIPFDLETDRERIYKIYEEIATGKLKTLPGVIPFIQKCRDKDLKMAVATSASSLKMNINLKLIGLDGDVFNALVCGDDISKNKPHPEIFQIAAFRLGLPPEDCLVIEDAPSGVEAAKKAGSKCMALLTSFSKEDLGKADWIAGSLIDYPPQALNW